VNGFSFRNPIAILDARLSHAAITQQLVMDDHWRCFEKPGPHTRLATVRSVDPRRYGHKTKHPQGFSNWAKRDKVGHSAVAIFTFDASLERLDEGVSARGVALAVGYSSGERLHRRIS